MKSTSAFKETIRTYLEQEAKKDEQFAVSFAKNNKNIDDCITGILNTVKNSGCNGFADEEIFGMAVHYYLEDNIEIGNPVNCSVVVNHVVQLSEEEKELARKQAISKLENEEYERMKRKRQKPVTEESSNVQQLSIF